jgi:hypothetical protein
MDSRDVGEKTRQICNAEEDNLVKPARDVDGPIKRLRVSKDLALYLVAETLFGPSLVYVTGYEKSHKSCAILSQTRMAFLCDLVI